MNTPLNASVAELLAAAQQAESSHEHDAKRAEWLSTYLGRNRIDTAEARAEAVETASEVREDHSQGSGIPMQGPDLGERFRDVAFRNINRR